MEPAEDIKEEIDRTRTRLDMTLSRLEARLNPRRFWKELTAGKRVGTETLMQTALVVGGMLVTTLALRAIRKHPLSALAGAGAAWLLMETRPPASAPPEPVIVPSVIPAPQPAPHPSTQPPVM